MKWTRRVSGSFHHFSHEPQFGMGVAELLGVGDVADRCVKPDVEHLALGTLYGHGDTPVEVAGHGTGLQAAVEPALALTIDIGAPFLVLLQNPLLQPGLVLIQRQIPVLGFALDQRVARLGVVGIDELLGRERGAALLALVAVGLGGVAAGALALDVAVGQEVAGLLVVELLASPAPRTYPRRRACGRSRSPACGAWGWWCGCRCRTRCRSARTSP